MSSEKIVVILAGGVGAPDTPLPRHDLVIAADGGYSLARELGLQVDLLVGDMDSIEDDDLAGALRAGMDVERHPVDKDETDLALALLAAARRGATRVIVIGGGGIERLDHVLANAGVLAAAEFADLKPEWWLGSSRAYPVRDRKVVHGEAGDRVSLVVMAGSPVVTTQGLRWILRGEELPLGTTRGVSNEMTSDTAEIEVSGGVVMIVHGGGPS